MRKITNKIAREIEYRERLNKKQASPDTLERGAIRELIINLIQKGESKMNILLTLNNQFPDSKNAKFFQTWIDYYVEKEQAKKEPDEKGEERD